MMGKERLSVVSHWRSLMAIKLELKVCHPLSLAHAVSAGAQAQQRTVRVTARLTVMKAGSSTSEG